MLMGTRDRARGEKAVADLQAQGLAVGFIQIDVTSQQSVDRAAADVERCHGRLDILVNNVGIALDWMTGSELTVDATIPVSDISTMKDRLSQSLAERRFPPNY